MKMRIAFLLCFSLAAVVLTAAQRPTVTNADLAKYEQARVKAEKDLRENYVKLGFPSPEERARRDAADATERAELVARLRHERMTRERAAAEVAALSVQQARYDAYIRSLSYDRQPRENYSSYLSYGYGRGFRRVIPQAYAPAWRADASGVVYEPGGRSSNIWSPVIKPVVWPVFQPKRWR